MIKKNYTCTVCPRSCSLTVTDVDGELAIEGFTCLRGKEFARNEYLHPMRTITSTVKVEGGEFSRVGVAGSCEIPKEKLGECLRQVYTVCVKAPVKAGEVLLSDVCGTGCDVLAAMDVAAKT